MTEQQSATHDSSTSRGKRVSHFRKLIRQCTSADGVEYYPISDSLQPQILDALDEACDLLESAQSETRQCDGCVIRDSTIANLHREGATKADIIDALEAADADLRSHNTRQSTLNNISRLLHIMATDRHSADDEEAEAAERAREACIGANLPANWKP